MKKIFLGLLVLVCTLNAYSQQQSFFMELGGSFRKTKSTSNMTFSENTVTKAPKIVARLGYAVSAHSVLGLAYNWSNQKMTSQSSIVNDYQRRYNQSEAKLVENTYGLFYRYYLMPLGEKRWNVFADINPGYFRQQQDTKAISMSTDVNGEVMARSETNSTVKWTGLDMDLGTGISYRLTHGLSAQLPLRSIANVKYVKNSWSAASENKGDTFFELFDQPLSNTYLSMTYQF